MTDTGYRSIEIEIANSSNYDLAIEHATAGSGSTWIAGEEAKSGDILQQYQSSIIIGAYTNDTNAAASFDLMLKGSDILYIPIRATIGPDGQSKVDTDENGLIQCSVVQVPSDSNHARFIVNLAPVS
jgi:hypothetical protein